jgi:phenylalanyl-tRNA synthetase beta chain
MDIGTGLVGVADVMEEIARLYGYDNIPETLMDDPLPPQRGNPSLEREERVRDIMVSLGLQEIITHRMTAPEIENRLLPRGVEGQPESAYVRLVNAISPEKRVLRRGLLAAVMNVVERNSRLSPSLAFFEVGGVFLPADAGEPLPQEPRHLAVALTGLRYPGGWDVKDNAPVDFYDLKGLVEELMDTLHIAVSFAPLEHPSFHPGKCAALKAGGQEEQLGVLGELHPEVQENYGLAAPILAAEFDLEAIIALIPALGYPVQAISEFPPILEDIAVVVDEALPAERLEQVIRQAGGKLLTGLRLFDIFRGAQIGSGKKSMAYALTYQAPDRTLTDKDAAAVRQKIIRRLEQELGAKLRS